MNVPSTINPATSLRPAASPSQNPRSWASSSDPPESETLPLGLSASGICHTDLHLIDGGYDLGQGRWLSFKDRVVSVALSKALEFQMTTVGCASTGTS